jgi:Mrp family chromosome partitioning ATPase
MVRCVLLVLVACSGRLTWVVGSVIVSTPQDVALSDVRKGIAMLKKVSVPVRKFPHADPQSC